MGRTAAAILAAFVPLGAVAADCGAFDARLDVLMRLTAIEEADAVTRHAPADAMVRELRLNRYMVERAAIFTQMQSHGCRLPPTPLQWRQYMGDALECRTPIKPTPEKCDVSIWTRK